MLCQVGSSYETEEIFTPNDCEKIAQPGDHVLIEFSLEYENQTSFQSVSAPDALFHIVLDFSVRYLSTEHFCSSLFDRLKKYEALVDMN